MTRRWMSIILWHWQRNVQVFIRSLQWKNRKISFAWIAADDPSTVALKQEINSRSPFFHWTNDEKTRDWLKMQTCVRLFPKNIFPFTTRAFINPKRITMKAFDFAVLSTVLDEYSFFWRWNKLLSCLIKRRQSCVAIVETFSSCKVMSLAAP